MQKTETRRRIARAENRCHVVFEFVLSRTFECLVNFRRIIVNRSRNDHRQRFAHDDRRRFFQRSNRRQRERETTQPSIVRLRPLFLHWIVVRQIIAKIRQLQTSQRLRRILGQNLLNFFRGDDRVGRRLTVVRLVVIQHERFDLSDFDR